MDVLQREHWNGQPEALRELFLVRRPNGTGARCVLWSHQLGWELRLDVNGTLVRSQVTKSPIEADSAAAEWRIALIEGGWR